MEKVVSLETVCAAISQVQMFLEPYLSLANTHGAEFLSENHWHRYLSQGTQARLLQLSPDDLVGLPLLTFQEDCKEKNCTGPSESMESKEGNAEGSKSTEDGVKDLQSFIGQAQKCHLEELNVLTPLEAVLPQMTGSDNPLVISEAMSVKKVHEVGIMVDTVSTLFRSTHSDLVVDIGSGKGYFASELALKQKIPVIGFDSKDTNTHGASQRDKKLAKKWTALERRTKKKQSVKDSELNMRDEQNNERSDDGCPPTLSQKNCIQPHACASIPCLQRTTERSSYNSSFTAHSVNEANAVSYKSVTADKRDDQHCKDSREKACELYSPVTLYVHAEMDLCEVVHQAAPHLVKDFGNSESLKLLLSGLHTCGSLAVTSLKLFLQNPKAVVLCCVGCCYQLMQEQEKSHGLEGETEAHFPLSSYGKNLRLHLGRNARNLASQSVYRIQASGQLQGGDFLWRALLNVLLIEVNIPVPERIVGMRGLNKRCKTFQDYVTAAFKKEGISEQLPKPEVLADLEARHSKTHAMMSAFFQLKLVLAPVIEALILLDRLAFLLEQEEVSSAHIVQLFDPVTSPRCFALIAMKDRRK